MNDQIYDVYDENSLLLTDDAIYKVQLFNPEAEKYEENVAYLEGEYYFIYRGDMDFEQMDKHPYEAKPGIYTDINKKLPPRLVYPRDEMEDEIYLIGDKIKQINAVSILENLKSKKETIPSLPENTKMYIPTIKTSDDILKRLLKQAMRDKYVDIDQCKSRFVDKNALFNFKQAIKKDDTKVSMLLFDRGCEALNLVYTITLEEVDPDNAIGTPLKGPIICKSSDSYDL